MNKAGTSLCTALLFCACTAFADTDAISPMGRKLLEEVNRLNAQATVEPIDQVWSALCTINKALSVALRAAGATEAQIAEANKIFTGDLVSAAGTLQVAARTLHDLAAKKSFQKSVSGSELRLVSGKVDVSKLKTADDVLEAIANLSDYSVSALSDMQNNKAGIENFKRIVLYGSDMSQLILLFYSIGS